MWLFLYVNGVLSIKNKKKKLELRQPFSRTLFLVLIYHEFKIIPIMYICVYLCISICKCNPKRSICLWFCLNTKLNVLRGFD